jgi:predicted transcriptional regulator of viral defense system
MRYTDLLKIKGLYFSGRDLADCLDIDYASARVTCARYAKLGLIVRLKRNFYMLRQRWDNLKTPEEFLVANILQVPSYISLLSALSYYDVSTQVQRGFVESISVRRTKSVSIEDRQFNFYKIKKTYYNNFVKKDGFFIATPEKALLDCIYLAAFGKYTLDTSAVDFDKINKGIFAKLIRRYPSRVQRLGGRLWKA